MIKLLCLAKFLNRIRQKVSNPIAIKKSKLMKTQIFYQMKKWENNWRKKKWMLKKLVLKVI